RGPRLGLERLYLGVAAAMFVARLATVLVSWQASGIEYRADIAALQSLPAGARLAVANPPNAADVVPTPLVHLPVLAAALRQAFVPTLFAIPGQQPIALAPPYAALARATSPDALWERFVAGDAKLRGAALAGYDYIVFTGLRPFALVDRRGLVPLYLAPRFQLYRVAD
ncbi:MAG: hypothetical protein ACREFQ_15600, partial [Stellaceae bacterium]